MTDIKSIPISEEQEEALRALGFNDENINSKTLIDVTLYNQAISGNVSAINAIKTMFNLDEDKPDDDVEDISKEVAKEEKELLKTLNKLSPIQLKINAELIHNVAFQSVTLRHLTNDISKKGVKEKYKNGANQWGYKDRTEVKTYNNMIKSYQSCMRQLNELLNEQASVFVEEEDDPFK